MKTLIAGRPGKRPVFRTVVGARLLLLIIGSALTVTFIGALIWFHLAGLGKAEETFYGEVLSPAGIAYDFQLVDQDGQPFRLSQLRGKIVLFCFGYTHCPDVCPTTLSDFTQIYQQLPETVRRRVQIVFISVDPERDGPATLKKYLPYFDASFIGLTGSSAQIKETAMAYGAVYTIVQPKDAKSGYYVNHSPFAYLITPDGKWRLRYLYTQLSYTDKVTGDIEKCLGSNFGG